MSKNLELYYAKKDLKDDNIFKIDLKNLNELQNFEEKKVFSKSYETNPKGKENQKNNSTDFIIKRNESSRGREGKTTNVYLNKSITNNVKIFLIDHF